MLRGQAYHEHNQTMMMTASPSKQSHTIGKNPEIEVLLSCARIHTPSSTAEHILSLLKQPFQWDYLIDLAKFHKVIPLLAQTLNRVCPDLVPKSTLQQLQTLVYANTCQNLFLTQELLHILKLFEQRGIPAISFKGPTLALAAYGSLSLRQIGDLDLLLPKDAIKPAQALLIAEGYQLTDNYGWEFHFTRRDGHVHIDLHQEIAPSFYKLPFDFQQLRSRTKPISIGGKTVSHLQPEDLLLLLSLVWFRDCTYLNSHFSLHLLSDVDALLRNHTSLDWNWILNQALSQGCDRILKLMLLSAQTLLGTDLPPAALDSLQSKPLSPSLIQSVKSRLFEDPSTSLLLENPGFWEAIWAYDHRFYLQSREHLRDRILYCLMWLQMCAQVSLIPNAGDWELITFPQFLAWLYYPLHIMRLIFKHLLKPLYQRLRVASKVAKTN
jgi:hypothetical protein